MANSSCIYLEMKELIDDNFDEFKEKLIFCKNLNKDIEPCYPLDSSDKHLTRVLYCSDCFGKYSRRMYPKADDADLLCQIDKFMNEE